MSKLDKIFIAAAIVVLAVVVYFYRRDDLALGNAFPAGTCGKVATSTLRTVGPQGVQQAGSAQGGATVGNLLVGTSTNRAWVSITNLSNIPVWLNFYDATATPRTGVWLEASSTERFDANYLWQGAISGIGDNSSFGGSNTTTVSILDCTAT